jgi:hypothetical protein
VSDKDTQTYLWPEMTPGNGSVNPLDTKKESLSLQWYYYADKGMAEAWGLDTANSGAFYASALPIGTTTGVLRHHALRQHSTASCQIVPESSFPSTCPGDAPFTTTFSHQDLVVRICGPGSFQTVPWTLSRNRQNISEELWIDVATPGDRFRLSNGTSYVAFTLHCTASSSRGYFELGNHHNGDVPGPLLEAWPSPDEMAVHFNDRMGAMDGAKIIPTEM